MGNHVFVRALIQHLIFACYLFDVCVLQVKIIAVFFKQVYLFGISLDKDPILDTENGQIHVSFYQ